MVAAAEPVALLGRPVGEDRELAGRVVEPRKLQPGVERGLVIGLAGEAPAALHRSNEARTAQSGRAVADVDEAPGLAEADRGRQARDADEALQRPLRQRVEPETPHVATPDEQVQQFGAERLAERYVGSWMRRRSWRTTLAQNAGDADEAGKPQAAFSSSGAGMAPVMIATASDIVNATMGGSHRRGAPAGGYGCGPPPRTHAACCG